MSNEQCIAIIAAILNGAEQIAAELSRRSPSHEDWIRPQPFRSHIKDARALLDFAAEPAIPAPHVASAPQRDWTDDEE